MRVRGIVFEPGELRPSIGADVELHTGEFMVNLGGGAYTFMTEGQLFEVAEAWRSLYEAVVIERHGLQVDPAEAWI